MKLRHPIYILAAVLAICITGVQAQAQNSPPANPSGPIAPTNSGLGGGYSKPPAAAARGVDPSLDAQPYDPSQVTPDQSTLAGAEFFSVGSLSHSRNIFDPAISVSEIGQTIPGTNGQPQSLSSQSLVGGSLSFDRTWSRYRLTAVYNGGETFYVGGYPVNPGQATTGQAPSRSQFHDAVLTQQINWARWHLLLRDDFMASPGAAFTGTGMGGPGLTAQFSGMLNATLSSLGQAFVPSDSIETGYAMRYRNSALGQAEYSFSRRSAFTFAGSYGILDFPGSGYFSSKMINAQAGYDYLLDPANSIAVLASYGKIDYTGASATTGASTLDYMAALAYGRKITGRLAFQVAAGPQQIRVGGTGSYMLWFESVNSSLIYNRRRTSTSFSFSRGLTSGSGVYEGATSNTFSGSARYQFTRFWTGAVNGGYALNNSLAPAGVATTQFNNWFIGANVARRIGPHGQINFNYGLQKQSSPSNCPVTSCGVTGYQQSFGMTLGWHLRPAG
jgi:hypothetical protein